MAVLTSILDGIIWSKIDSGSEAVSDLCVEKQCYISNWFITLSRNTRGQGHSVWNTESDKPSQKTLDVWAFVFVTTTVLDIHKSFQYEQYIYFSISCHLRHFHQSVGNYWGGIREVLFFAVLQSPTHLVVQLYPPDFARGSKFWNFTEM